MYYVVQFEVELTGADLRSKKAALRSVAGKMTMRDLASTLNCNVADIPQGSYETLEEATKVADELGYTFSYDGAIEMSWVDVDGPEDEDGFSTTVYGTDVYIDTDGSVSEWHVCE